jgi:hypothetical protein
MWNDSNRGQAALLSTLPHARRSDDIAGDVRREMLGPGFALVDTPRFFELGMLLRLKGRKTVLPFDSNRWWTFPQLARYACWLESLLDDALTEESLSLTALEFRHEPAGSVDKTVDRLHIDGSYLRSVCAIHGPTTFYWDRKTEKSVPAGQTLLMTAMGRAKATGVHCTLHRRPGAGPERAVIVCSFEPRGEQKHLVRAYHRAALEFG